MTRTPPELPERKPAAEMTPAERSEYLRELAAFIRRELAELNRARRDRKLRAGLAKPRNPKEWELFAADWKIRRPDDSGEADEV